jgi:HSP20 family protein
MVEKTHLAGLWPALYDPFRNVGRRMAELLAPASDASSDDNAYHISVELPGVREDDIDVSVHDGVINVTGEKKSEREEKGDTWFFSERQFGSFSRVFRLPADADGSKIDAKLKDGVLEITVPKMSPEKDGAKKVKISKG